MLVRERSLLPIRFLPPPPWQYRWSGCRAWCATGVPTGRRAWACWWQPRKRVRCGSTLHLAGCCCCCCCCCCKQTCDGHLANDAVGAGSSTPQCPSFLPSLPPSLPAPRRAHHQDLHHAGLRRDAR